MELAGCTHEVAGKWKDSSIQVNHLRLWIVVIIGNFVKVKKMVLLFISSCFVISINIRMQFFSNKLMDFVKCYLYLGLCCGFTLLDVLIGRFIWSSWSFIKTGCDCLMKTVRLVRKITSGLYIIMKQKFKFSFCTLSSGMIFFFCKKLVALNTGPEIFLTCHNFYLQACMHDEGLLLQRHETWFF